jgi:hypothetical protein
LQNGAETGLGGFITYNALWVVALLIALRLFRTDSNSSRMVGLTSLAVICVFALDSIFSFPNQVPTHSVILAVAIGTIAAFRQFDPEAQAKSAK